MEQPINDPVIPYVGTIRGDFLPRKMVRIQGSVPVTSYRFDINLQCGPSTAPRDDVAFRISLGVLEGYVSVNSLENGVWGEELQDTLTPTNLARGQKFEVLIFCELEHFKVAINGQHFCDFQHRIPYHRISHLAIDGDVSIVQITYETELSRNGVANGECNYTIGFKKTLSTPVTPPPTYDAAVAADEIGKSFNAPGYTAPCVAFTGASSSYSTICNPDRRNLNDQSNLRDIRRTAQPTRIVHKRLPIDKILGGGLVALLLGGLAVLAILQFLK